MSVMRRFLLISSVLLLACHFSLGQSAYDGAITGTVTDASGRAASPATVIIRNEGTGRSITVQAGESGDYRVPGLSPGQYGVSIEATGLERFQASHVTIAVGETTTLNAVLGIQQVDTSVVVSGAAPAIDTESAATASVVNERQISNLPINGRRWSDFVLLTPGTQRDPTFGLVSFRGISGLQNNNTIDGADNNDAFWSEERGRALRIGYSSPQAAVEEFQVNTANFSSEYGRAAGGVVNTVTRSGSNALHGEAYVFDRDNRWGATNPFTVLSQSVNGVYTTNPFKPVDRRKQAGLGIGGPLLRDRLFFFFAFDFYQRNYPAVAVPGSPATFFASATPGQLALLASRLNTTPADAQQLYNEGLTGLSSLLGQAARNGTQTIYFPKLDWQVSAKHHSTFEVNRMMWAAPGADIPGATYPDGTHTSGADYVKVLWGLWRFDSTFSPSLLNQARFQYGKDLESEPVPTQAAYEKTIASPQLGNTPSVSVAGTNGFSFGPWIYLPRTAYPDERRTQFADTLTKQWGHHTTSAGLDYNYVSDYSSNLNYAYGNYTYTSVLNYLSDYYGFKNGIGGRCDSTGNAVGTMPCYTSFLQGLGPQAFQIATSDYAGFVNDTWKPTSNLTLTLGLRYEFQSFPPPISSIRNSALPTTAGTPVNGGNFGPRLGVSWDPMKNQTTVLHAGYGLYYGRVPNGNLFAARIATGSSNAQTTYLSRASTAGAPVFPNAFEARPAASATKPSAALLASDLKVPQLNEVDAALDQQLDPHTVLTIGYMGSFGRRLPTAEDVNIDATNLNTITYTVADSTGKGPIRTPTFASPFYAHRLNSNYGQIMQLTSSIGSNYNAAYVEVKHRMAKNLEVDGNFVWSHSLDDGQSTNTVVLGYALSTPYNVRADYANSDLNVPHRLVVSAIATAPWTAHGWLGKLANGYGASAILLAQSGLPYSLGTTGTPTLITSSGTIAALGAGINGSGGAARIPGFGRNNYTYPAAANIDFRLSKNTQLSDRFGLELLAEAFNLLNHQNVTGVNTTGYIISGSELIYNTSAAGSPLFGQVNSSGGNQAFTQRQIQLAAKIHF